MSAAGSSPATTRTVLHAGFLVTGAVTTLLGPVLPLLIARWSLSDAEAGLFLTLQFCGNLTGIAVLGVLLARRGYRFTLSLGFALMAAGVAGLMAAGALEARICTFVFGGGLGLNISGVNLWVGEDSGSRRAAALSLLNMTWGLGAVLFPPLVMFAERLRLLPQLMLATAGLCVCCALFLALGGAEPRAAIWQAESTPADGAGSRARLLLVLGCLFFIYVGTEASVASWIAALAQRIRAIASPFFGWTLAPMFFWAGLLTGRAVVPLALRAVTEHTLLLGGVSLAAVGICALLAANSFAAVVFSAVAAGLGMACVYPLLAGRMLGVLGADARRRANIFFALGCAGGATLPWLVGFISSRAGDLRAGLLVSLAGCLAMLALLLLLRRPWQV